MQIIIFLIPFITAGILLWKFRKETVWWEYIVLILPSLLIGLLLECIFKAGNTDDTEYYGDYITKVTYYEPWDEMVWVTHTREVPDGKNSDGSTRYRTETYETLEREYHDEYWTYNTNSSRYEHHTNKELFDKIVKTFNVKSKFIDMNRDYHSIDGDAYEYSFDGNPDKSYTLTTSHSYSNPIKGSRSIFKFEKISDEEAQKLGLYDYNEIVDKDQSPISGIKVGPYQEKKIRWINAYYGQKKQFRLYILFFKGKPESIAEKQKSYWEGGNKNELVCCVGLDNKNKVTWSKSFSWEDTPNLSVKSQNWFLSHSLDLNKFYQYICPLIEKEWHRKEFKDFSYLTVEINDGQYICILVLILFYNIIMSIFLIANEYTNDEKENNRRKWNNRVHRYYNYY